VQVDGNDIFRLRIIEASQDSLHELTGVGSRRAIGQLERR
jgi:hypothetical protein